MSGRKYSRQGYNARKKKRDANEKAIVDALEAVPGVMVVPLDKPVDLLVGYEGKTLLIEVKNPDGKNRMEKDQTDFFEKWPGATLAVVRSEAEALELVGVSPSGLAVARIPR